MRGTRIVFDWSEYDPGIIPAYAGNTWADSPFCPRGRDHPRVCGEHELTLFENGLALGSSPRMRGTPRVSTPVPIFVGIIPAYAGNTASRRGHCRRIGDHPRVCGEHPYRIIPIPEDMGSSPRMRGTLQHESLHVEHKGIIPAYAGNTQHIITERHLYGDHPRVCGEHLTNSQIS